MATVTLTQRFAQLNDWPGNLFWAGEGSGTVVTARSSTAMTIELGAGTSFPGFEIQVTGTGFSYIDGVPVAGEMTELRILNDGGQTVIVFAGLEANEIASDLSGFYHNMFGSPDPEVGPGPDAKMVWNHLLAGSDTVVGTNGDDDQGFVGFDVGNDTFNLRGGNDWVSGGVGNDTYFGGAGFDRLSFESTTWNESGTAFRGATFNVAAGTVFDPWGGTDRISGIEAFVGSRFADTYNGGGGRDDVFEGLRGRDRIDGGANSFSGGVQTEDDWDWVYYSSDHWQGGMLGIVVDLETSFSEGSIRGFIRDGFGTRDTVIDVEHVEGTRYGDVFTGSRVENRFVGGEGQDSYNGAGGEDRVSLTHSFCDEEGLNAIVDMTLASGQTVDDGFGNTETVTSIEQIDGTEGDDQITMNGQENWIQGMNGADIMTGGGGADAFCFLNEDQIDDFDVITDFDTSGPDADRLVFDGNGFSGMTLTVRVVNGMTATTNQGTFLFRNSDDILFWDEDGTGSAGPVAVATLTGVSSLAASHFEIY